MRSRYFQMWMPLLALAVMAGCVSKRAYELEEQKANEATARAADEEKLNAQLQKLNGQLESEIKADRVQIEKLENELKVTIVDEILFPEGGWRLHRSGEQTLDKIIPTLMALQGQRIEVQGYTDDVPIGHELKARFQTNWELSTARATDVVRHLQAKGVDPNILSATGFGETRPAAPNSTVHGRAKNRRTEILIKAIVT